MSIEAGATLGWAKYVGDRGFAFGIDQFGDVGAGGRHRQGLRLHAG